MCNLRNNSDFEIPFIRLCSYETSFIPSTLKLWNDLDQRIRSLTSLLRFKSSIKSTPVKTVDYISKTERKFNIILTRIKHRCSSLKADLYRVNIVPNSTCSCGALMETAEHYFFECDLYNEQRERLFRNLNPNFIIDIQLLTTGSPYFDFETNKNIILSALKFIKDSHRFD